MKGLTEYNGSRNTKQFVGRRRELHIMREWLENPAAPFQIFAISGIGGIGKSTLMAEMMRTAKEEGALTIWLDGRFCTQTPAGFLEYLTVTAKLEIMGKNFSYPLEPILKTDPDHRVILCIDNFENLSLLEGWLMEALIPKLSLSGIVILLTSRPELSFTWKMDTILSSRIIEMPLTFLSYEETAEYIMSAGVFQPDQIGGMARASDGHPLALALAVETAVKGKGKSGVDDMVLSQSISAHILKELTLPELQPMVEVLIILQHANQEMLSLVLGRKVSLAQYQELKRMSFVLAGPEGLTLHDLARIHLLRDFRMREPKRLNTLRAKAAAVLHQQLQSPGQPKRRMIAAQMLWLCKDVFPLHRLYVDLTFDSLVSPLEPVREGDLPSLHELVQEWCDYSIDNWRHPTYHAFLEDVVKNFPESIAVLRDMKGKPIAMFIHVLLYNETSRLLLKYFPAEMKECCKPEELFCKRHKADTYYSVLGAATDKLPGYSREELVGLIVLDRLSLLGEGLRAVLLATNSDLKIFLKQLGFQLRPTISRDCDNLNELADVLELDLRENKFGNWIMSFFKEKPKPILAVSPVQLSEKVVRKLLSALNSPAKLQTFAPYFSAEISGIELQKKILFFLTSEKAGLSKPDRDILYTTYYTYDNNRVAAMQACNMSRATFYRHLNKALSNFTEMLKGKSGNESPLL
jgi:hypothetical protein